MARKKSVLHCDKNSLSMNGIRLYELYSMLAKNRFKWINLPNGIESRVIEEYLFEKGQVAFYDDPKYGLICLPCSSNGMMNIYNQPTGYFITGNGYQEQVNSDDVVRVLNNDLGIGGVRQVLHYVNWISSIEDTMYFNLKQQRKPYIVSSTRNNQLSVENVYKKMDEGEEKIVVDENLSAGGKVGIEVLQTNAPYLLDKLQDHKDYISNELLSWLGLNNTDNKKERLLVDEVNVNNSHILMNLDIEFKNRELACKAINEKFGTNISVIKTIDELQLDFLGAEKEEEKKPKNTM